MSPVSTFVQASFMPLLNVKLKLLSSPGEMVNGAQEQILKVQFDCARVGEVLMNSAQHGKARDAIKIMKLLHYRMGKKVFIN